MFVIQIPTVEANRKLAPLKNYRMRPNRVVIVDKHRCTFVAEIAVVGGPSQIADGLFFNVFARGVVHAGCENLKKCFIFNPPASEAIKGVFAVSRLPKLI